jgi:hypothetical protein
MRGYIVSLVLALLFCVGEFVINVPALADSPQKPLMIIRFGDNPVDYEQSLDKAVKITLAKKPSVAFDVVAVIPQTKDEYLNRQNEKDAKSFAQNIITQITHSGVLPDKVHMSEKVSAFSKTNEIQIFVQ